LITAPSDGDDIRQTLKSVGKSFGDKDLLK